MPSRTTAPFEVSRKICPDTQRAFRPPKGPPICANKLTLECVPSTGWKTVRIAVEKTASKPPRKRGRLRRVTHPAFTPGKQARSETEFAPTRSVSGRLATTPRWPPTGGGGSLTAFPKSLVHCRPGKPLRTAVRNVSKKTDKSAIGTGRYTAH